MGLKIEKPDQWPRALTRAERAVREAAEYLEFGKWDKGMMAIEQAEALLRQARWNCVYRLGVYEESK